MKNLCDIINRLTEIAQLEGSEIGEALSDLINIYGCSSELSDEFNKVIEN
jgi:hypothetical protein